MGITNNIKALASQIAQKLDKKDGQNNRIDAETWKKFAVAQYGAKDNVKQCISIFNAEKSIEYYLKKNAQKEGISENDIGQRWLNSLDDIDLSQQAVKSSDTEAEKPVLPSIELPANDDLEAKADATRVDKADVILQAKFDANKKKVNENLAKVGEQREIISSKMHTKWSSKFKNSNLDKKFYTKLYDVIKKINCSIDDKDFKSDKYSSKMEQTMDEVIAVLAGESKLNSKAKNYIYRGIFQLDSNSLTTVKAMAKKYNINGVKQNISLAGFANLSGAEQLDYLIGHVAFGKLCSNIKEYEKITPQQLWAMIKLPSKGQKDSLLTQQKARAINRVFTGSQVERGIA